MPLPEQLLVMPQPSLKKPWVPPKLLLLDDVCVLNNVGGQGDGDAQSAQS